ncbi:MAG: TetR/AcrR family transcriptional regulator, partial [Pseudomonadota bacterium]
MRRSITERGYAATSLDHIIAEVGGSRRNIYVEFGDKAGLMAAVVAEVVSDIASAGELPSDSARDPRDWLVRVGIDFTRRILDPEVVAILRELVSSGGVAPGDARMLWEVGPDRFRTGLARWLTERHDAGDLDVPDITQAAATLPEMMRGVFLTELLIGRRTAIAP